MGNEIILSEEIERVDWNNPMSIFSYGSKLLEEMGNYIKNVSLMTSDTPGTRLDIKERLAKINSFSNYLETTEPSEKLNGNTKLLPLLQSKITTKITAMKNKLFGIDGDSFADQYSKLDEELDAIKQTVEQKKQAVINNMQIDRAFIESMNIYIERLEKLIEQGIKDLDAYRQEIEEKKKDSKYKDDFYYQAEIKNAEDKSNLFEERIDKLKKNLVVAKNAILETMMKEKVNMQIVLQYQEYNESTIHALRIQTTSLITTKSQREELTTIQTLNDITNDSMKKNSRTIVANIEKANQLVAEGSISVSTLRELSDNIKKGLALLKQGEELIAQTRKKEQPILDGMISSFTEYSSEISEITHNSETTSEYMKRLKND